VSGAVSGIGVNLYPWDVVGDPACAGRLSGLGADRVTLAAAYHTVRALTPRHPAHKVVTAGHSAVYYRPDRLHWQESALCPAEASWAPDSFVPAARALREEGLKVYGWAVLAHNQRLGTLHPEAAVVNAYGDRYPWALCIATEEVGDYSARLAGEIAALPEIDGLELESCGWYGFDHLHAHDKTAGVDLDFSAKTLFSLCFCGVCCAGYAAGGIDPVELRAQVRGALDPVFTGRARTAALDPGAAAAVHGVRAAAAARYRARVLGAVRARRPGIPVLLHTHPDPLRVGSNPGAAPADLFALGTAAAPVGAVLACWRGLGEAEADVAAMAAAAPLGAPVAASLLAVAGMGGRAGTLAEQAGRLRAAGADELRLYHAGLAAAADLDEVRSVAKAWETAAPAR
jgi:hypothetical protein